MSSLIWPLMLMSTANASTGSAGPIVCRSIGARAPGCELMLVM
jgi:hypothetical protein